MRKVTRRKQISNKAIGIKMASMLQREVAGLVGSYLRAWVYGGVIGAGIALYFVNSNSGAMQIDGLHDSPIVDNCDLPSGTYRGVELPCYDQKCLEAFGYYVPDRRDDVKKLIASSPDR